MTPTQIVAENERQSCILPDGFKVIDAAIARQLASELEETKKVLNRAIEITEQGLDTDGSHHKQWCLALILEMLAPEKCGDRKRLGCDLGICP